MVAMERGQELHGRACRGENLSNEERAELEAWYAEMDAEEAKTLKVTEDSASIEELRRQMDLEVLALRQAVEEIQAIHTTNQALRQEIADLKRRLADKQSLPDLVPQRTGVETRC
jgi:uncharacterized protein involved in exopolysaccharide biosynthesis